MGEYIGRMDACLSTCDQVVSNRSVQRDQMVRYQKIVCEGLRGEDSYRLYPLCGVLED